MHLRNFGFPRIIEDTVRTEKPENLKKFLWKKTNFVTDMPKHGPISRYLVAKTSNREVHYYMHVSILHHGKITPFPLPLSIEYNPNYKVPDELKKLQHKRQKLFDEDIRPPKQYERLIMCHMLQQADLSLEKGYKKRSIFAKRSKEFMPKTRPDSKLYASVGRNGSSAAKAARSAMPVKVPI